MSLAVSLCEQHEDPHPYQGENDDEGAPQRVFHEILQRDSCNGCGDGGETYKEQHPPVPEKKIDPVSVKAGEQGAEGAAVQGDVEGEGVDLPVPAKEPGEKDEMGRAAHGEEF